MHDRQRRLVSSELDNVLQDVGVAEVIVKLKDGVATGLATRGPVAAGLAIRAAPNLMGLFISRGEVGQRVAAREGVALAAGGAGLAVRGVAPRNIVATLYPKLGIAVGLVNRTAADALRENPGVESVAVAPLPRLIRPVRAATAVPKRTTWGLSKLNIPQLWDRGLTGTGVLVGHLDTGVDGRHPALAGAIGSFAEFDMAGKKVAGAIAHDSGQHGTHTAGTIVGRTVDGKSFGVAPGAQLASGLVIEGGDVISRILSGMEWIVGLNVRILSMSLGLPGYTPAFKVIVDALRQNNVLPIFAIGNEGVHTSRSPGNYETVLSVGAFGVDGAVANWSSSDAFARPEKPNVPDLVAPGVDVISCVPGGGYESMDGTSMATPHIAGLVALLLQARPNATTAQLEDAITISCRLLPGTTVDRAGKGVPDGLRALTAIMAGAVLPPLAAYVPPQRKKTPAKRRKTTRRARGSSKTRKMPARRRKSAKKTRRRSAR